MIAGEPDTRVQAAYIRAAGKDKKPPGQGCVYSVTNDNLNLCDEYQQSKHQDNRLTGVVMQVT